VAKRKLKTKEAVQVFLEHLEPGDQKTHGDLVKMLQEHVKGVSPTQCSGMIYRCRTNADGVLEKTDKFIHWLKRAQRHKTA